MKVRRTLNAASLPKAADDAVKDGYERGHAERVLTAFVEQRFLTDIDPGDEHELDRLLDELEESADSLSGEDGIYSGVYETDAGFIGFAGRGEWSE